MNHVDSGQHAHWRSLHCNGMDNWTFAGWSAQSLTMNNVFDGIHCEGNWDEEWEYLFCWPAKIQRISICSPSEYNILGTLLYETILINRPANTVIHILDPNIPWMAYTYCEKKYTNNIIKKIRWQHVNISSICPCTCLKLYLYFLGNMEHYFLCLAMYRLTKHLFLPGDPFHEATGIRKCIDEQKEGIPQSCTCKQGFKLISQIITYVFYHWNKDTQRKH